jgi:ATP-binding cassette subfamily F protein uup
VVDHLLVFKGQGDIKDFPGNYTQYREWASLKNHGDGSHDRSVARDQENSPRDSKPSYRHDDRRRLSYKEKREMEQLEKDIAALEDEKKQIEETLCGGTTSVDEITAMSKRLPVLNDELDEKSMRWLELSEIES